MLEAGLDILVTGQCLLSAAVVQEDVDVSEEIQKKAAEQAMKVINPWLAKSTVLVVGPGLGQDPIMCMTVSMAIKSAIEKARLPPSCLHHHVLQGLLGVP